ncbi:hypothetical protein H4R20_003168 [Coemansia guatemalensis]|uniref:Aminoglycoside phosphotransferase domain-containing protein n=1 Tax=Coemansia guatemalensis TaxID=2761395 RepID=A0A9W8I050_9FUNG|nr:hypothetical protein H4R20_003168 [Coemansia guatemalensis]
MPSDLVKNTEFSDYVASATSLTGGMINNVWRISRTNPPHTVVIKHAGPALKSLPALEFSVERMAFEARGLALFCNIPTHIAADTKLQQINSLRHFIKDTLDIHIPRLLHYNETVPFIILEDIGSLPDIYKFCTSANVSALEMQKDLCFICERIGQWIARLHGFGRKNLAKLKPLFTNYPARRLINEVVYDLVCTRIVDNTSLVNKLELVDKIHNFRNAAMDDNQATLIFGDLWTGSVLFDKSKRQLYLLDFEFSDIGHAFADIAHFVAHLLPLHFFCNTSYNPNVDPCPPHIATFLTSYSQALRVECPDAYDALIGNGDLVRESTMFFGIDIARDVLTGNWCRCGIADGSDDVPLSCACADMLLPFAANYINGCTDSLFKILL